MGGYRIPSMAEIAAVPLNGLRLASLFSGCGGSSLGFRMAGFEVVWANEFLPEARACHRANFPETVLDPRDIRDVTGSEVLAAVGPGGIDVLEGSPPCSSFSMSGKRASKWGRKSEYSGGAIQRCDDLFFEFGRLLSEIRPMAFVAENVTGLLRGDARGYFRLILRNLRGAGYRVGVKVLDAARLGVPQRRERVFFVGVREDLGADPPFPVPSAERPISCFDAIPWWRSPSVLPSMLSRRREKEAYRLSKMLRREWDLLRIGQSSVRYFNLTKIDPGRPAPTLTAMSGATCASVCHPFEPRKLSVPEALRLCSFPDDFELVGTYAQRMERLGRSVPPLMARAAAEPLCRLLLSIRRDSARSA